MEGDCPMTPPRGGGAGYYPMTPPRGSGVENYDCNTPTRPIESPTKRPRISSPVFDEYGPPNTPPETDTSNFKDTYDGFAKKSFAIRTRNDLRFCPKSPISMQQMEAAHLLINKPELMSNHNMTSKIEKNEKNHEQTIAVSHVFLRDGVNATSVHPLDFILKNPGMAACVWESFKSELELWNRVAKELGLHPLIDLKPDNFRVVLALEDARFLGVMIIDPTTETNRTDIDDWYELGSGAWIFLGKKHAYARNLLLIKSVLENPNLDHAVEKDRIEEMPDDASEILQLVEEFSVDY